MGNIVLLRPTIYSKAKDYEKLELGLIASPDQKTNTPAAYRGHVFEFVVSGTQGPVGTLDEYREHLGADIFVIELNKEVITVKYKDGKFYIDEKKAVRRT